jgi:hypothetical protein
MMAALALMAAPAFADDTVTNPEPIGGTIVPNPWDWDLN